MTDWSAIATAISDAGGGQVDPNTSRAVGGGCINRAYRNHLNLFGTGYLGQAEGMLQGLLAQVR